ncbi:pyridoxamine 5'-phosphate oxidase family protein [Natronobiforma cellulositropha]|uniref:pyridoxamine 5'-phosphate oxidase family protein n=1 Tax=Natronobiforma cellulositropha TaxID=1679076 RepID=UPI0021D5B465|nr:pyridoxamine 5'-phosphate oxidase family protein [Natronobiforma cellulositropha]
MRVAGSLPAERVERFLESTAVPLRLACRTPADTAWIVSLWFRYTDGSLQCATAAESDLVTFLESDPHVGFEVSTNDPPYRGVRGNGTATLAPDPEKALLRDLLERYLGTTDAPLAERLLDPSRSEVSITIEPAVVSGWDYSRRMSE